MGYRSLLVHLDLGRSNANLLAFAVEFAQRFEARVMGIAASAPPFLAYADVGVDGESFELERSEIGHEIGAAEAEFRAAFRHRETPVEWRAAEDDADLVRYVSRQARNADLLLTAVAPGDILDRTRAMHTGALVMQVGRPVLLVPLAVRGARLDRVLVGWKDTRETRRAIADALPLLCRAEVTVVEVAKKGGPMEAARRHLDDVVGWLVRHGVAAKAYPVSATGDDAADLRAAAQSIDADVIVAGAYGHSRVREWMLGGVTKDLLLSPHRCCLVSH
jgi:nucleotide-binding universal stress UspA family protein